MKLNSLKRRFQPNSINIQQILFLRTRCDRNITEAEEIFESNKYEEKILALEEKFKDLENKYVIERTIREQKNKHVELPTPMKQPEAQTEPRNRWKNTPNLKERPDKT